MLYLSGTVLAFFLSFLLITKKNKAAADYVLMAWLAITGFHLLCFYLAFTYHHSDYLTLVTLGFSLPLVQGPLLYIYTCLQTTAGRFRKRDLLHFLPFAFSLALFWRFHLLSGPEQAGVFRNEGQGFETEMTVNIMMIYASGVIYVMLSLYRLLRYRRAMVHQFSNTDKINFNWLLYLIIWMSIIWATVLLLQKDKLVFGAAALFIIWLGYFGIKQVQIFSRPLAATGGPEPEPLTAGEEPPQLELPAANGDDAREPEAVNVVKYQRSSLSDEEAGIIHQRLKLLLVLEKPFVNPDLTLQDLAKSLDVHPNHLSQVINSLEQKTFYDLVNEKRVEEFIVLTSQPQSQQYTLLSLAYDCGFNSKASFNRNFKKYTGLTPSDYLRQQSLN